MNLNFFDDPDLPSYQCPTYRSLLPKWELVADMEEGRSAWFIDGYVADPLKAEKYLPTENQEPEGEYLKRLRRSYFERRFGEAIESYAGFLSGFTVNPETIPSISDALDDIDRKGNSLEVFLRAADEKALRDERCFVLVEFPKRPQGENGEDLIRSALDERNFNLRPYLVLIDVRDVLNWKLEADNRTIRQVTIREHVTLEKGLFGIECKCRYRVLQPGRFTVYEIEENALVEVDSGTTSLNEVPLIPYSVTANNAEPFCGSPPLYDLAELNLKHYQKTSEKDEAMHKCNLAVLQVKEASPAYRLEGESQPIVQIGPNTCLWNVDASFVEPSGAALRETQADIERLELSMNRRTLAFLTGSEVQRTATEVLGASSPVQANLGGMARAKESAVQRLFQLWGKYVKADTSKSGIQVDKQLLNAGLDSTQVGTLLQIRSQGELTRETFLNVLKEGKALPKSLDVKAEIAELERQELEAIAAAQKLALEQMAMSAEFAPSGSK